MSRFSNLYNLYLKPLIKFTSSKKSSNINKVKDYVNLNSDSILIQKDNNKKMIPTVSKAAKQYIPLIKFLGPDLKVDGTHTIGPHPMALNGISPNSPDCVSVKDFLAKQLPFKVVQYQSAAIKTPSGNKSSATNVNQLDSISQLPAWLKFKDISPNEIDIINGGGVV